MVLIGGKSTIYKIQNLYLLIDGQWTLKLESKTNYMAVCKSVIFQQIWSYVFQFSYNAFLKKKNNEPSVLCTASDS